MPDAYRQLRYRRLLFLPRLLRTAPDALLRVMDASVEQSGSFAFTILSDLQWLGQHSVQIINMEAPPSSLHQWLNFCGSGSWKSYLRNAYYNDNRLFLDSVSHATMLHDICKTHARVGLQPPTFVVQPVQPAIVPPLVAPLIAPVPVPEADDVYFCYECWTTTTTTKAWHNHRRAKHGIYPVSKYLVDGHVCKVCLTLFPTISRMYQHLESDSRRCLAVWEQLDLRLTPEQVESVDALRKSETAHLHSLGYRETKSLHPCVRVLGPFHPLPDTPIDLAPQTIPTCKALDAQQVNDAAPPVLPGGNIVAPVPEDLPSATFFSLPKILALNIKLVLHLFSGQRRDNDLQAEFEAEHVRSGLYLGNVIVLSLDIVLHPQLGDLTNPQAIALWQDLIVLGVVVFVMAGPPCETWSAARFLQLESDGSHGPRPLRTTQQLWGLTCLRKSEANSVAIGNALLRAVIRMFYAALCNPTVAVVMEHPRLPHWIPNAPSSWLLPELQCIASGPNARSVQVDQCMVGAPSMKPTTLLCLQVNRIALLDLQCLRCDRQHVHQQVLRGLDEDGLFRTAPAKQYPRGLCSLLARLALGQFLDSCSSNPPASPLLDEFSESVLSKFYVPTDYYTDSVNSYGADLSVNTGTYKPLPQLPSGKAEAAELALATARANTHSAMSKLVALPNGKSRIDKFGHSRVVFNT